MIKITKELIKEPLLHFMILGAIVYSYFSYMHNTQEDEKKVIKLSSYELQELKNFYKKTYAREADKETLKILIAKKYYDSVLLDKAFSLKIAQNDPVVAQRLLKKMQFVMQDRSQFKEPSQQELAAYYKQHIKAYSHVKSISFSSIYFHDDTDKRIEMTMQILRSTQVNSADGRGFSEVSKLPYHVEKMSYKELEKSYGRYFAKKIFVLQKGMWHQALHAKDGARIVFITDEEVGDAYDFDVIEGRVYADYIAQESAQLKEQAYKEIAAQYSLKVE